MTSSISYTQSSRSSRLPKWQQVLFQIEAQFDEGVFEPNQPFPTLGELSTTYGVSDITARRVFRELKNQGRIITQGRRGTFIAPFTQKQVIYMCLPQAQLALVTSGGVNETNFFGQYIKQFHQLKLDQRFDIKTLSIEFCLRNPQAVADTPLFVSMEAILKVHDDGRAEVDTHRLEHLQQHGKAIVFRSLLGMVDGVDQVSIDYRSGIEAAVTHLVQLGHRHIAMLSGKLSNLWHKPRFEGFLNAMSKAGLTCDPHLVKITTGTSQKEDFAAVARLLAQTPRPTAIVCANDIRAIHVLEYCQANRIAVPHDLAVIGMDNAIEGSLFTPSLTTLDPNIAQVTSAMFDLVERQADGDSHAHEHVIIQPQLIKRDSTTNEQYIEQRIDSLSLPPGQDQRPDDA